MTQLMKLVFSSQQCTNVDIIACPPLSYPHSHAVLYLTMTATGTELRLWAFPLETYQRSSMWTMATLAG